MEYEPVIGLEVHVQLRTRSKMFCGCAADYQIADANTRVCPVCMAMPGVLPVVNKRAVEFTIAAGLALNCSIAELTKFDRKNYGYPDLMKGYQISQMDLPIAENGYMNLPDSETVPGGHRVGITRIHLEEDVARLTHIGAGPGSYSLMDINRAGVPLMECVSEPDIRSAAQAEAYILELQSTMRYLGISTANMEEGSFRCDANVSIRPKGAREFGKRVEVKNMNRVRAVVRAIEHEIERQTEIAEKGGVLPQETRGWDDEKGITLEQRSKEEANDYRYFPEPDIPPIYIERAWVDEIRSGLPELANSRRARFAGEYGLSQYDADLLTASRATADYFENVVRARDYSGDKLQSFSKESANWINGEMARLVNADVDPAAVITESKVTPAQFAELVELFQSRTINNNASKQVLAEMFASGRDAGDIVDEKGLRKVDDADALDPIIDKVISDNDQAIDDYLSGKETAIRYLVGQVMKATRGAADANVAAELIQEKIGSLTKR
ncbi:MAG: Asp-tRNA(Asn)/Glu-tRNA(Gln) amidotransferase subunit GatB [Chloroflexi bacterium]|nr:Asp-tRNA(Asn)/Glu-tRNA(Gln) amidotransferase subunit GatB [Chloroflexota bacterium]